MNDQARHSLCKLIGEYGANLCNTPRSCEMFVRQNCGAYPAEMNQFLQALKNGVVTQITHLKAAHPWDKVSAPLVEQMRSGTNLSELDAQWTVDSWALALGKHPSAAGRESGPSRPAWEPAPEQTEKARGSVAGPALWSGFGGALGGFFGAAFVGAMLGMEGLGAKYLFEDFAAELEDGNPLEELQKFTPEMVLLMMLVFGLIAAVCGALGGGAGGALMGAQSSAPMGDTSEMRKKLLLRGFIGAISGAFFGAAVFGWLWGLPGLTVFTLIGAASGAITSMLQVR